MDKHVSHHVIDQRSVTVCPLVFQITGVLSATWAWQVVVPMQAFELNRPESPSRIFPY
jgi:hypothetical protein